MRSCKKRKTLSVDSHTRLITPKLKLLSFQIQILYDVYISNLVIYFRTETLLRILDYHDLNSGNVKQAALNTFYIIDYLFSIPLKGQTGCKCRFLLLTSLIKLQIHFINVKLNTNVLLK